MYFGKSDTLQQRLEEVEKDLARYLDFVACNNQQDYIWTLISRRVR